MKHAKRRAADLRFRRAMAAAGFKIVKIRGDGNCLFRAASFLMFGNEDHHAEIRKAICDHMREQANRFMVMVDPPTAMSLNAYCDVMEHPVVGGVGEWGNQPEITAMEEVYDRRVDIYEAGHGSEPRKTDFGNGVLPEGLDGVTPLRLSRHNANHYNAVVKEAPADGEERVPLPVRPRGVLYAARVANDEADAKSNGSNEAEVDIQVRWAHCLSGDA